MDQDCGGTCWTGLATGCEMRGVVKMRTSGVAGAEGRVGWYFETHFEREWMAFRQDVLG